MQLSNFSFCTRRHDMEVIVSTFGALFSTGYQENTFLYIQSGSH